MKSFQIPVGMVCPTKEYGEIAILNDEHDKAYALALTTTPNALKGQVVRLETKGLEPYTFIQPQHGFVASMFNNVGTHYPTLKSPRDRFRPNDPIVFINPNTKRFEEGYLQMYKEGDTICVCFPNRLEDALHYFFYLRSDIIEKDLAPPIFINGSLYKWDNKTGVVLSNDKDTLVVQELGTRQIWHLEVRA